MAKEQGLPLNSGKISGVCGRLLCCLSYENDNYIQAKQSMPQIGTMLNTPSGPGKVVSVKCTAGVGCGHAGERRHYPDTGKPILGASSAACRAKNREQGWLRELWSQQKRRRREWGEWLQLWQRRKWLRLRELWYKKREL